MTLVQAAHCVGGQKLAQTGMDVDSTHYSVNTALGCNPGPERCQCITYGVRKYILSRRCRQPARGSWHLHLSKLVGFVMT